MTTLPTTSAVDTVRSFNRFYTRVIGVLGEGLLHTSLSLTEVRVLFELAQRDATEVADLRRALDLDAGYLSRMLGRFEADGLVTRRRSDTDARRQVISLTEPGRATFDRLDTLAAEEVELLLAPLADSEQRRLLTAMDTIRQLLEPAPKAFTLRALKPGDLGWVIQRHGALYAEEYGWDATFETLVARILTSYAEHHDPQREAGWIAEVAGEPVGCVFSMRKDDRTAQLRLLLVEPGARGLGIGARLVDECITFARRAGYARIMLWTNDVLTSARHLYERAGFTLDEEEPHHSFGHDLVGQVWSRPL
jgi:DNA-binding MarR family transcriptional regulator/GNAT superfamily N-acetyltransferase